MKVIPLEIMRAISYSNYFLAYFERDPASNFDLEKINSNFALKDLLADYFDYYLKFFVIFWACLNDFIKDFDNCMSLWPF